MTDLPSYDLELKAADERRRLHDSIEELRCQVRDKLDVSKHAREHLGLACSLAAVVSLTTGYAFGGMFVHR
jgi:hypothetical protein